MKLAGVLSFAILSLMLSGPIAAQASFATLRVAGASAMQQAPPQPQIVDSPNVKILTGLYAQQFQEEMNFITQALGVNCNTCHARGNFASEEKALKQTARRMLEMTRMINKEFFPDHKPKEGESVLGRVTCYTCHQGEQTPKLPPGH